MLDSQSVKTTESGGPRGYDASKKIKGRKRHVMVGTGGRGLILEPQPADVQDRDGALIVLRLSRRSFPFIIKAFADSGYAGEAPTQAISITIEIVRKPPIRLGLRCSHAAGRWRGSSPGSAATGASGRSWRRHSLQPERSLYRFRHAPRAPLGTRLMIYGTGS